MKIICSFLFLCFGFYKPQAQQLSPTTYLTGEGSLSFNKEGKQYHFINPGGYQTLFKGGNVGVFTEAVFEPDAVWSIAPGIFFAFQSKGKKGFYYEFGGGPGFERIRGDRNYKVTYLNSYFYLENHADSGKRKGKIILSLNVSYAKAWEEPMWRYAYLAYYPFGKVLALRLHSQSYAVDGAGLQVSLGQPVNIYMVAGKKREEWLFQTGLNFLFAKSKKK